MLAPMKLRYKILGGFFGLVVIAVVALSIVLAHTYPCEPAPSIASGTETMKAIRYRCYGSADVLEFADVEMPRPATNEVLVSVKAAAVNPLDWHYMRGSPYFLRLGSGIGRPKDTRLGVDFAGVVAAVGSDVTRFVLVPEDRAIALKPESVSFEQAASVPIAALTALQALRDSGQIQPGDKVLINGASGGVGTFAVQIAKAMGAEVHGVCSTRNVEMVRSLGADHVFDYKQENYTESGNQYDLIVDMVSNHSLSANRRVLQSDGRLVLVGGAKGNWIAPMIGPIKAMLVSPFVSQEITIILAKLVAEDLTNVADLMSDGAVTPAIDRGGCNSLLGDRASSRQDPYPYRLTVRLLARQVADKHGEFVDCSRLHFFRYGDAHHVSGSRGDVRLVAVLVDELMQLKRQVS
jgi:NADPH:quinone reductase-like Zn-dependent oxidoreductase